MRKPDKKVDSISKFITYLKKDIPEKSQHVWYRGQSKKAWKLVPSLARKNFRIETEAYLIKRFRQNATLLTAQASESEWHWLLIMQHHGVPTRLLDWTESPLAGLYFAVIDNPKTDGALWVLLPTLLNEHSNIKPALSLDIPSLEDPIVDNYSTTSISSEQTSRMAPIALIVPRNTPRIQAQLGVFTVIHRDPIAIDAVGNGKHVWRYVIPASVKAKLLKELALLGINKFSLFPELQSIGDTLKGEL